MSKPKLILHYVRYCQVGHDVEAFLVIPPLPLTPPTIPPLATNPAVASPLSPAMVIPCLENHNHIFPTGDYPLRLTFSPKFNKPMPEICGVAGRSGIRIHLARDYTQLQGCIGLRYDVSANPEGAPLPPDTVAKQFADQKQNLETIKTLCQTYEITLSIHHLELCWSHVDLFNCVDRCTGLVLDFPRRPDRSLAAFLGDFARLLDDSLCIYGLGFREADAYRATLESIAHYISQCALLSLGHQPC